MNDLLNKHTPGPWEMKYDPVIRKTTIWTEGTEEYIAELDVYVYPSSDIEEATANALLISLAPEMKDRIEKLEDVLRAMIGVCGMTEQTLVGLQASPLNQEAKDYAQAAYEVTQIAKSLLKDEDDE